LLFPPRRRALLWFLPALLVQLLVLIPLLTISSREGPPPARPLPRWALALAAPEIEETPFMLPPPPPAALPVPRLARPLERAPAPAPSTQAAAPTPVELTDSLAGAAPDPGAVVAPSPAGAAGAPRPLGIGGPRRPVAERLRPGQGDPRLYVPLPEEIVGLSAEQLAQLDLDLAIAEVMDSVAAAEAAGRRATDWTYTDSQGRRWGVSPGQIHLGGITIPLPFGFSAPRTADASRRARQDAEIARQAERATATTVLKDRAAEIRRRRDAERARARTRTQSDTTGGA
jgi:hypothetical protein